jgi:chromosome segregation ATPase
MQEMDRRVAILRLLLADLGDREREAAAAATQLRAQLARLVDFTVQYNGSVQNALGAMAEVEERITRNEALQRHLHMLRERAQSEVEALLVTRGIADARARLAELEARRATLLGETPTATEVTAQAAGSQALAEIDAEIASLRAEIHSASEAAARSLARPATGPLEREPRREDR